MQKRLRRSRSTWNHDAQHDSVGILMTHPDTSVTAL